MMLVPDHPTPAPVDPWGLALPLRVGTVTRSDPAEVARISAQIDAVHAARTAGAAADGGAGVLRVRLPAEVHELVRARAVLEGITTDALVAGWIGEKLNTGTSTGVGDGATSTPLSPVDELAARRSLRG